MNTDVESEPLVAIVAQCVAHDGGGLSRTLLAMVDASDVRLTQFSHGAG